MASERERMDKAGDTRAGGADWVRKLAVDVAATGSALVQAQGAFATAVRASVSDDPCKVRTVRMAEAAHAAAEARYASERTEADRRGGGYDPSVITLPGETRDHRRRPGRQTHYRAPPCGVAEYVARGVRGERGYHDADRFGAIPASVSEAARKSGKLSREAAWVARWRHWGNRGAGDLTSVVSVEMPYVRAFEEQDYQARLAELLGVGVSGGSEVSLSVGRGALVLPDPYCQLSWLRLKMS